MIPHARAMAALVHAFAYLGELDRAFMLYNELQRDSVGASAVTLSDRSMWQSLIETACRKKQLPLALKVRCNVASIRLSTLHACHNSIRPE